VVGYPVGQYPDTSPGFAVYPDKWRLDKGRQETDIAHIFCRETAVMERDIPRANRGILNGSQNSCAAHISPF
jgi:hypothetical protein